MPGNPEVSNSAHPPPNRRRDKPQLSCQLCRRRKRRCDRGRPCGTCTRLGRPAASCTYPGFESERLHRIPSGDNPQISMQSDDQVAGAQSPAGEVVSTCATTLPEKSIEHIPSYATSNSFLPQAMDRSGILFYGEPGLLQLMGDRSIDFSNPSQDLNDNRKQTDDDQSETKRRPYHSIHTFPI